MIDKVSRVEADDMGTCLVVMSEKEVRLRKLNAVRSANPAISAVPVKPTKAVVSMCGYVSLRFRVDWRFEETDAR